MDLLQQRTQEQAEKVAEYAMTCPLGTLCAFWVGAGNRCTGNRWLRTAKMVARTPAYITVECLDGKKMKVYLQDLIWVKTGRFWPKFIFDIFAFQKEEYRRRRSAERV